MGYSRKEEGLPGNYGRLSGGKTPSQKKEFQIVNKVGIGIHELTLLMLEKQRKSRQGLQC